MSDSFRVLYYQLTLGPAHMARIRALDAQPGIECLGVALAEKERTRNYQLTEEDRANVVTVMPGTYEDEPLVRRIRAARSHLRSDRPDAIIVDSPADPVQWMLGSTARGQGTAALTLSLIHI